MGDDKTPTGKRNRKAPVRFQPWQVGDAHSPMALRSQKSKLKKDQKRFRDMKKQKEVGVDDDVQELPHIEPFECWSQHVDRLQTVEEDGGGEEENVPVSEQHG